MTGRLQGKAAIVVSGSSGFGEAIARRFVREGAQVVIATRGEAKLGRFDAAVNSAGFADSVPIAQLEPDRVEKVVAVQYAGTLVAEGHAPYAGGKAGGDHVTRITAVEHGARKIHCNVVSSTTIETRMIADLFKTLGLRDAMVAETPLGDLPEIEDGVNAALFFASDGSRFVTGQNQLVDAGGSLRRLPRQKDLIRSIGAAMASSKPQPQLQPR